MKQLFRIGPFDNVKLLADAAYDATDIYKELHYDGVKPVIATNGCRFRKSPMPKDKDYGKRWQSKGYSQDLKRCLALQRTNS